MTLKSEYALFPYISTSSIYISYTPLEIEGMLNWFIISDKVGSLWNWMKVGIERVGSFILSS
jgi:hypothetical protein